MEYSEEIVNALRDERRFIRLTLSGPAKPDEAEWQRVVLRRVLLSSGPRIQAVLQGKRKQVTQTLPDNELEPRLRDFLDMGFRHINLQCADGDLHVRITRKGKALVSRGKPSVAAAPLAAAHDREKDYPFPANRPDAFLEKLGIMRNGRVVAAMRDKFRQINQFLKLLCGTKLLRGRPEERIRMVDCGCGRAFLTFAAYHYLRDRLGLSVELVGVDADDDVLASAANLREAVGVEELELVRARIGDYEPTAPPQVVLSLHACDMATDEAIAQGVRWGAELILCVPCCQHELHHRILSRKEFRAALRHGILRERMADILTDALRAAALRVMGYKAEVIEFISPGHTAKNLMIRAEKTRGVRIRDAAREYLALRDEFLNVTPCIEQLLGQEFANRLNVARTSVRVADVSPRLD